MSFRSADIEILPLNRVEIAIEPWSWPFAITRRGEIDRHFARIQRERPAVWNGRVLLLKHYAIDDGGVLRGACFETDFASLCAWRDWKLPDACVYNIFAAAALRGSDGGYLVGEMAPSTANAGLLYFPCGTPEPGDVDAGGFLDLAGNLFRELREETGLDSGALDAEAGWTMVRDGGYIAVLKVLTAAENTQALRARIMNYIAREERPEFADIRILASPADFTPAMPRFVTAYLQNVWRARAGS